VTGAAGFIGSHLAERLAHLGHDVLGIDSFSDYYAAWLKQLNVRHIETQGVSFLRCDLAVDDLAPILQEVAFIYHLAAQPGISAITPFDLYLRNNIVATQRLLAAVQKVATLQGVINISTSSVYGEDATGDETNEPRPTSYYGVTKLAAEQLVLAYQRDKGMPATSLRLFSVYGPRERPEKLYPRLIHSILANQPFPLYEGSKNHLRSYTYVADIIDGLVAVLDHMPQCNGEIFNIGTDVAVSTGKGIRLIEEIIGQTAQIAHKPRRPGDQLKTHANIEKARRILGYNPHTTIRAGLEKEVAWYKTEIFGKIK